MYGSHMTLSYVTIIKNTDQCLRCFPYLHFVSKQCLQDIPYQPMTLLKDNKLN